MALALFDGEGTAVLRYADAKQAGGDPRWAREVGFVEHHHGGRMLLRGTFAGHYLDVDESDHFSQRGAGGGAVIGGLAGALLGPVGIPVGFIVGGVVGSQAATPGEIEAEPELLAEQLRAAVPRSSSAVVLIAPAKDVDEMVAALGPAAREIARATLSPEQEAALAQSLGEAPPVSSEP